MDKRKKQKMFKHMYKTFAILVYGIVIITILVLVSSLAGAGVYTLLKSQPNALIISLIATSLFTIILMSIPSWVEEINDIEKL